MNAVAKIRADEVIVTPAPVTGLALLREPFPPHQVSKLPKPFKKDAQKGRCAECGGWHGLPAAHLDYVGHAALTDRLLNADPEWSWEPVAFAPDGLPAFDRNGGLWIRLTVCGVTRLGYGDADGKSGGNAVKEAIGDALRNAAMRFGAALDLWHKGDLHADAAEEEPQPSMADMAINLLRGCGSAEFFKSTFEQNKDAWKKSMSEADVRRVWAVKDELVLHWKKEAERDTKPKAAPLPDGTPFDDEIPF